MKSNKKRILFVLAVLTMALVLSCALVACDKAGTDKTGTDIAADYKVTIHPNNGQSDIVWDITKAIPTITKDGFHIAGYFLDAQLTISTTLESLKATGITKNIDVYVKWEEDVCEHVEVTDNAVAPTCTEKGLTEGKHCSKCGKILTAQTEIDALGHDLENHDGQEATCTEKGWKAYVTCKREGCDHTTYEEIPALGHTGGTATCTEQAVCERCNEKYGNALGHKYGTLIPQTNATCSATGIRSHYKCSSCNKLFANDEHKTEITETDLVIPIDENAHNFGNWTRNDGAETHTRVCSFNSEHTETEDCFGGTATCTEQAVCERCNEKYGNALGHKYGDLIPKTEPTCSASGTEAHYKCSVCNKVFKDDEHKTETTLDDLTIAINPDAHNFGKWIRNNGSDTHTRVCSFNSEHTETENCHGGTATCTDQAVCEKCNEKYGELAKHDYKDNVCIVCGAERASEGLAYSLNCDGDGYTVTGIGSCKDKEIIIPSKHNSKPVTSIGDYAFNSIRLTSVTIPDSLTSIGSNSFGFDLMNVYYTGDIAGWCRISGLPNLFILGTPTLYIGGNKVEGDLIIPRGVTSIGDGAFYYCTGLTSVTIPDSVTSIGYGAFAYCTELTSITIPDSVTSIGSGAFAACTGLTNITIPNRVTSINDLVFSGCSSLTSITIPNSVTSIGIQAFAFCSELMNITIPDSVTSIVCSAFDNTAWYNNQQDGLVYAGKVAYKYKGTMPENTSLTLKEGTLGIGVSSFADCSGLTSITIPDSVTSIGEGAFKGCTGLTSITGSATNVSTVATQAKPTSFTVNITSGTSIGSWAFEGCTGLTNITIPDSVTNIGCGAFNYCTGLTSVTIPDSVTRINEYAFRGCTGLTSIVVKEGNTKYHSAGNCLIETESKTLVLGCKNSIIPADGSVTSIGDESFDGCSGLTSIAIPDSVTIIGDRAFYDCKNLINLTIGKGVTSIGENAFHGCSALEQIIVSKENIIYHSAGNCLIETESKTLILGCKTSTIPSDGSVLTIGCGSFESNTNLVSIVIPDSITTIEEDAFWECTGLKRITIGNDVKNLSALSFFRCSGLEEIIVLSGNTKYHSVSNCLIETENKMLILGCKNSIIPTDGSVTSIGDYAFSNRNIISITIPNTVTSIGEDAFSWCKVLTSVIIGNSVTNIGRSAFNGCTKLTAVSIPDSVTSIGEDAFNYCASLTNVTIGNSVTEIGDYAFSSCTGLTSIKYNGTIAQWNAITKGNYWNSEVPAAEVVCTDGTTSI